MKKKTEKYTKQKKCWKRTVSYKSNERIQAPEEAICRVQVEHKNKEKKAKKAPQKFF